VRILYIARHGQRNADDEGAITHALTSLGHEVVCQQEYAGIKAGQGLPYDLLLFHHWNNLEEVATYRCKKAFWCFDLIDWPDPTLERRCQQRKAWVKHATDVCDFGFMTDGDWVMKDTTGNLHWLPQGADERVVGAFPYDEGKSIDVLFTGIAQGGGKDREEFVHELKQRCCNVVHVTKGTYREELRRLIGRSKIVVAPDSPVTDNYWSNRAWNTLGFGGFMLHPYCKRLAEMYDDGREIVFYDNREHMFNLIKWYLEDDTARRRVSRQALERTEAQHVYRRRCEILLATVRDSK
jgi:hypothetical protein